MPRDANGNTQPLPGTIVSTGDTVLPSQHNPALVDLYAMMTQSLSRDGQGGMRANLDLSTFKAINLAAGVAAGDAVNFSQLSGLITVTNINSAYQITIPAADIMIQFGQSARTTNAIDGTAQVEFPVQFSATPQAVMATNATAAAYTGNFALFPTWTQSAFSLKTANPLALNTPILVTWLAIGQRT